MPTPYPCVLCLCVATLAVTLSGCAADRLKPTPPSHAPHLAGNWTLDAARSEHVSAAVTNLQSQLHQLLRKAQRAHQAAEREEQPASGPQPARESGEHGRDERRASPQAGGSSNLQEPGVEVSAPMFGAAWVREFIGHVPVGDYLGLRLTPGLFTLRSAGGIQECTLGIQTAIAFGDGGAVQTCGWDDQSFVVRLAPLIGPQLTERFALSPHGELVMTLHMSDHGIDVRLIRRYRRTPHAVAPALLPTSD
ncbi:MAG: hypothetical protein ACYCT1_09070 [Steroidobacteraceae bacterium]